MEPVVAGVLSAPRKVSMGDISPSNQSKQSGLGALSSLAYKKIQIVINLLQAQ
jgi:hypothetical protein